MTLSPDDLAAMKTRLERAPRSPWTVMLVDDETHGIAIEDVPDDPFAYLDTSNIFASSFIAHAPEDIRRLLDEVEALRSALNDADDNVGVLSDALERIAGTHDGLERHPAQHCTDLARFARHTLDEEVMTQTANEPST